MPVAISLPPGLSRHAPRDSGRDRAADAPAPGSGGFNPAVVAEDALRADACLAIPDGAVPTGERQTRAIRGGRYAVVPYVGPYAELERPYRWLYGTWLAQSGEELDNAPAVEAYLDDARSVPPTELKTEIWLPLR